MNDWAWSLLEADRHQKKATQALTLACAGIYGRQKEVLLATAEEHLVEQLRLLCDTLAWVRKEKG